MLESIMTLLTRRSFVLASVAMILSMQCAAAVAYPERPVTVIVPYAAGGAGDTILRMLQPIIERNLGQPLVIDNRAGGGGTIGAQAVARAAPDGHTLMLGATNNFVINQFMFPKQSFDPLASFALITKVADVPSVLYVNANGPWKNLGEFIADAKANPGKFSYASPSVGTTPHLAVERLMQLTGIELVHVPYRGAPPAMQALIANDVNLYLAGWGVGKGQVESGHVRALAIASPARVPNIPLPTTIESGVPNYAASNWWALAAPRGTPQPVLDKIYKAVTAALADPGVVQRLDELGYVPGGEASGQFLADAKAEAEVWAETIIRGKLAIE
jgi:tripartite-type tricarboxylate transporter receptor subunit TctC